MSVNPDVLEDQLQDYEAQLRSLNSYIKALNDRCIECGTDKTQVEVDLMEAEHNVKYYEGEIARLKQEIGQAGKGGGGRGGGGGQGGRKIALPPKVKQGLVPLIISSISFAAGTLLGSKLKSRRGGSGIDPQGGPK
jgi:TolA-binding protein